MEDLKIRPGGRKKNPKRGIPKKPKLPGFKGPRRPQFLPGNKCGEFLEKKFPGDKKWRFPGGGPQRCDSCHIIWGPSPNKKR